MIIVGFINCSTAVGCRGAGEPNAMNRMTFLHGPPKSSIHEAQAATHYWYTTNDGRHAKELITSCSTPSKDIWLPMCDQMLNLSRTQLSLLTEIRTVDFYTQDIHSATFGNIAKPNHSDKQVCADNPYITKRLKSNHRLSKINQKMA